jgi:hypothetical protein
LLLSLGRIATRNFGRTPKGRITIEVSFMTGGERLAGEGWVYL